MPRLFAAIILILGSIGYISCLNENINQVVTSWLIRYGVIEKPREGDPLPTLALGSQTQIVVYSAIAFVIGMWLLVLSFL